MLGFVPEIILFFSSMALLLAGGFGTPSRLVFALGGAALAAAMLAIALLPPAGLGAGGRFMFDTFTQSFKLLIFGACLASLVMAWSARDKALRVFEFPVLLLLAASGMALMVSAQDLLALYLGLELQSLPLYVLAAMHRDNTRSGEAGIKYFVLGALASGFLLYGASLLYGVSGGTDFATIAAAASGAPLSLGMVCGFVFLLAGLAFKLSAVPFHMWTPDVYEGAPTAVTGFFAVAPKLAAMALLARVLFVGFAEASALWQQLIIFLGLASIALGAAAAIGQSKTKRLLAYSSIGNMGYALLALASGTSEGLAAAILYLTLYGMMTIGVFACLLALQDEEGMALDGTLEQLKGLSRQQPFLAFCLAVCMFSLAGIPPLAGFFAKFAVFRALVDAGLIWLAVVGIVLSVVAAVYYLKVVRIIYLDEGEMPALAPVARPLTILAGASAGGVLLFLFVPGLALALSEMAAHALVRP